MLRETPPTIGCGVFCFVRQRDTISQGQTIYFVVLNGAMTRNSSDWLMTALIALMVLTSGAHAMARGQMVWGDLTTLCLGAEQVWIVTDAQGLPLLDQDSAPVAHKHACLDCHLAHATPLIFSPTWQSNAGYHKFDLTREAPTVIGASLPLHKQARAPPIVL
jgi:hypothetical protein